MDFYSDINKDSEFRKKHGAHFTSEEIVIEMCSVVLDLISIKDLNNFKFLDIASGTGVFSYYFAKMLAKKFNVPFKDIIENNCQMAELDPTFISKCHDIYNHLDCQINLIEGDALFHEELLDNTYDVVIGNPPYIRIQNLDEEYRKKVQREFKSCSRGASDLYLAFIERSMNLMINKGCMALITPSSYLRSEAGKYIREYLSSYVYKIKDFGSVKKFNCGTYTAITYVKVPQTDADFIYELDNKSITYNRELFKNKLLVSQQGNTLLKNICKIKGGIATLRDKIFIIKPNNIDKKYLYIEDYKIELAATKRFVKLSETKNAEGVYSSPYFCIYPYKDLETGYTRYSEEEFKVAFPGAFKYLSDNKQELLHRDRGKDKGYTWFEFGRTQGLINVKECVVTSTMNSSPNFFKVNLDGFLFGSGLALYDVDIKIDSFLNELNSDLMKKYIYFNGAKYAGNWRGYNKKILEQFKFYLK